NSAGTGAADGCLGLPYWCMHTIIRYQRGEGIGLEETILPPPPWIGLHIPNDRRIGVLVADDAIMEAVVPDMSIERWPPARPDSRYVALGRDCLELIASSFVETFPASLG